MARDHVEEHPTHMITHHVSFVPAFGKAVGAVLYASCGSSDPATRHFNKRLVAVTCSSVACWLLIHLAAKYASLRLVLGFMLLPLRDVHTPAIDSAKRANRHIKDPATRYRRHSKKTCDKSSDLAALHSSSPQAESSSLWAKRPDRYH